MEVQRESTIYELQGSIFIRGTNYLAPKDATPSEIDHLRPCSIQLHPLPSLPTSSPSARPISPPPPVVDSPEPTDPSSSPVTLDFNLGPFLDLTLDPGQDLIVLATRASNGTKGRKPLYQIHLMDMQGKPREDVKKQILEVDVTLPGAVYGTQETSVEGVESGRMLLQVLEGTLVCLVSNTVTELEMEVVICWDWKTGEEISRLPVPETLVYPSISLLTPRSYTLLGFTVNGICPILITYHLSSPSSFLLPSPPTHRSTSLPLPPPPRRSLLPTEISSRLFPALHREALSQPIMLLDIRPDPPSSNTPFVFGGPERRRRPHTTDPRKGVLEFDLLAGNRLFYGAGPKMVREQPLEWEEWGVNECRLFEAEIPVQRSWVSHFR
ncbi:hypothetical protein BDY24DRAFT_66235 [Mrakia frigida]|uniref:uncharacterized protein n=1 Tax=Mrakia frigida TaxID=29902 RepID=UPI003FCC2464